MPKRRLLALSLALLPFAACDAESGTPASQEALDGSAFTPDADTTDAATPEDDGGDEDDGGEPSIDADTTDAGEDARDDGATSGPKSWQTPARISPELDGSISGLQIAVREDGDQAIAVWSYAAYASVTKSIWASTYSTATGWTTATRVDGVNQNAERPQVAIDNQGNAVVVWEQSDGLDTSAGLGARTNVWQNRFKAGVGWIGPMLLETLDGDYYTVEQAHSPRVAVRDGNAHVVWVQGPNGQTSVWESRYTPASGWTGAALVEQEAGNVGSPNVVIDDAGNTLIAWSQYGGAGFDVWASVNGAKTLIDSRALGNPFQIALAMIGGDAVVAWVDGCSTWGVRREANTWSAPTEFQSETSCTSPSALQVVMPSDKSATVVWTFQTNAFTVTSTPGAGWSTTQVVRSSAVDYRIAGASNGDTLRAWRTGSNGLILASPSPADTTGSVILQAMNGADPRIGMGANGHGLVVFTMVESAAVRNTVWAASYR